MNTFKLALDLDKATRIQVVTIRQGDAEGTTITATVRDHGELADLSAITGAEVEFKLPDGEHYYRKAATIDASASTLTVLVDEEQAASVPGRACNAYFSLSDGTHEYSTASFVVVVLKDATAGATPGESYDDDIQAYVEAWLEAQGLRPLTSSELASILV